MNMLTLAVAIAIVIMSTAIVITQIDFTFLRGKEYAEFSQGERSLEKLDMEIRNFGVENEGAKRLLQFNAGTGILSIYGDMNMIEYFFKYNFGLIQNFTRNNIEFIYEKEGTRLRINYTDVVPIIGNESSSGKFFIVLKKNPADIEIDII